MKNNLQPRKETSPGLKLVGIKKEMNFANDKTPELWKNFMPKSKLIKNIINDALYSVEIYDDCSFFNDFKPDKTFQKWAAISVSAFEELPEEMEELIIPEGTYAVFILKGSDDEGVDLYQYIFETWLPASIYCLDNRPHFAVMGEKYIKNDPESEEEIWIPIRSKLEDKTVAL